MNSYFVQQTKTYVALLSVILIANLNTQAQHNSNEQPENIKATRINQYLTVQTEALFASLSCFTPEDLQEWQNKEPKIEQKQHQNTANNNLNNATQEISTGTYAFQPCFTSEDLQEWQSKEPKIGQKKRQNTTSNNLNNATLPSSVNQNTTTQEISTGTYVFQPCFTPEDLKRWQAQSQ